VLLSRFDTRVCLPQCPRGCLVLGKICVWLYNFHGWGASLGPNCHDNVHGPPMYLTHALTDFWLGFHHTYMSDGCYIDQWGRLDQK